MEIGPASFKDGHHPDGGRNSKTIGSESRAEKFRRKIEGELAAGIYETKSRKSWVAFREEYEQKIAAGMKPDTRRVTLDALRHFERLCKPKRMETIKTQIIDSFVAKRRVEAGKKKGDFVSPSTINKELRHLKPVLGLAHEWGYLGKRPRFRMLKEPCKLPRYIARSTLPRYTKRRTWPGCRRGCPIRPRIGSVRCSRSTT